MINFEVSVLNLPPQITYFIDGLIGMDFLLQFKSITPVASGSLSRYLKYCHPTQPFDSSKPKQKCRYT